MQCRPDLGRASATVRDVAEKPAPRERFTRVAALLARGVIRMHHSTTSAESNADPGSAGLVGIWLDLVADSPLSDASTRGLTPRNEGDGS